MILGNLNPAQRSAVLHESGPLLILAGAGSGKTRTITHRMAHLIDCGCAAESLLAITFTNKAAKEMQERMEGLIGVRSPWISTFHSYCARILRRHIERLLPYGNSFTIYDAGDSRNIIKEILEELEVDRSLWSARAAQEEISRIKNAACGDIEQAGIGNFANGRMLRSIYEAYTEALRKRNAVDFDDLLLLTVRLFTECPDVLARYQDQFRHVLIDEYQDTNAIQYRLGRLLTATHRNLCITGDPDQSIYGWRGANLSNILNFEEDYPDARVITLAQNYRSTQHILDVANSLIVHNGLRKPKTLWTEAAAGEPVRVYRFSNDAEEATEVALLIQGLIESGTPHGDIAVLYRINALSRPVEKSLIYAGIPYSIVGSIAFFLRREVKDVLAYLRILDNPRDEESLKRILNVPTRGIGKATIKKLVQIARSTGRPLLDLLFSDGWQATVNRKAETSVSSFVEILKTLRTKKSSKVQDLVQAVIEETRFETFLRESRGDSARDDIENVWQLVAAGKEYDTEHQDGTLTGFLEVVNLLGDIDRWRRSEDKVPLMTIHSAKGLEFPVVVILGVEDGILPLLNAEDPEADIEEERRLLYVGVTRARDQLFITHTANRMRFGSVRAAYPSRFLRELQPIATADPPTRCPIEIDEGTLESIHFLDEPRGRRSGQGTPDLDFADELFFDDNAFDLEEDAPYPVGSRVRHADHGVGEVVRISGIGSRQRVTVAFEETGEKQFVVGYVKLERIR